MPSSIKNIIIPNKISWVVDLSQTDQNPLSKKVIQRISRDDYPSRIKVDILDATKVPKLFYHSTKT